MSIRKAHNSNWRIAAFLLVGTTVLQLGCSSSSLPPGPKGTVTGKVTYNGNPVPAGSTITFIHGGTSLPAMGQIGADGSFKLMMQGGDQVPAGTYAVSVSPPPSAEISEETDMEAYKAIMEGGATAPKTPAGPFPQKYQSAETSGVTFDVKEGANTFDLDMKDDAQPGDSPNE
jgi:hypothetical protein